MELVRFWHIKTKNLPVEEWMEEHPDIHETQAWDKMVVERTCDYLHDAVLKGGDRLREVACDARAFLRALVKSCDAQGDYCKPVWEGMLKIKADAGGNETLLKCIAIYLDCMWT